MYDIVIKGGRVIDPAQNLDGTMDVAINGNKIATVDKEIPSKESKQLIDAKGKIVTPGLIDVHSHVFDTVMKIAVEPDVAGVKNAVTTVVDGGSAGEATFDAFPKYIMPTAKTSVFCFLSLCSFGQIHNPELDDWDEVNLDRMAATIEVNKNIIKGIKLRLVGKLVTSAGIETVKTTLKIARQFGLSIMIHIGDMAQTVSPTLTQECLAMMEKGDILSHIYTSNFGGILQPDGTVMPELIDAMKRGVVLDTAGGRSNFCYSVARKSLAQGILPNTLSTDLTHHSLNGPTYNLPCTMAKLMALGLDLKQVITMTTINPARAIREDTRIGSLKPGMAADVSILEIQPGAWTLSDTQGETVDTDNLLMPITVVKDGEVIKAEPVSLPPIAG
jgi:dihydroorotase